jgi:DNA-binding NtrC family response regulator
VRVISATNTDLRKQIEAGRFRQDLFFRLNTIEIHLPPLRERLEDVLLLAKHYLAQHAHRYRKNLSGFEPAAMEVLVRCPWPGNVRELNHVVERAVLMARGTTVTATDLGLQVGTGDTRSLEEMSLEEVEAALIKKTLARFDGNAKRAAEALGLSRSAFYRRLEKYGL